MIDVVTLALLATGELSARKMSLTGYPKRILSRITALSDDFLSFTYMTLENYTTSSLPCEGWSGLLVIQRPIWKPHNKRLSSNMLCEGPHGIGKRPGNRKKTRRKG